MNFEEFVEKLIENDEYECSCHINAPCGFCTDTVVELYEEWCRENNLEPIY